MIFQWTCPNCSACIDTHARIGRAVSPVCPSCARHMIRRYTPPVFAVKPGPSDLPGSAEPATPAEIAAWEAHSGLKFKK